MEKQRKPDLKLCLWVGRGAEENLLERKRLRKFALEVHLRKKEKRNIMSKSQGRTWRIDAHPESGLLGGECPR